MAQTQKSKIKWVSEGNCETSYFHFRRLGNLISSNEQDNGNRISRDSEIENVIVDCFLSNECPQIHPVLLLKPWKEGGLGIGNLGFRIPPRWVMVSLTNLKSCSHWSVRVTQKQIVHNKAYHHICKHQSQNLHEPWMLDVKLDMKNCKKASQCSAHLWGTNESCTYTIEWNRFSAIKCVSITKW